VNLGSEKRQDFFFVYGVKTTSILIHLTYFNGLVLGVYMKESYKIITK
jgi:hypothetical protein